MLVALVALSVWCVNCHVDRHPVAVDELLGKPHGKLFALAAVQLCRQRNLEITADSGVLSLLSALSRVP